MTLNDKENLLELYEKVIFAEYLDPKQKLVLLILVNYCRDNICRLSLNALCDYSKIDKKSKVSEILKYLANYKYINIIRNGNKTNKYEVLDIDVAEEYAQQCEEKQQSDVNGSSSKSKDIIENSICEKDTIDINDDIKELDVKENNDSNNEELCQLKECNLDCSDNRYNENKSEITIYCEDIKRIKVVAERNKGEEVNLILYSSDKIATTVFNVDRFRVEYRKLE